MPARERPPGSVRRRIEFDGETWHAVHKLSLDSMKSLQELADEAFADLLKKHGIPVDLRDALRKSASITKLPSKDNARSRSPGKSRP